MRKQSIPWFCGAAAVAVIAAVRVTVPLGGSASAGSTRGGSVELGIVPPMDAISREFTIFRGEDPPRQSDAISREFAVFRGEDPPRFIDAVAREFSVFRGSTVTPTIFDAISREFTVSRTPLSGDTDGNCVVNFADIGAVLANFGNSYLPKPAGGPGDADGDAIVDFSDIASVLANFGAVCQ